MPNSNAETAATNGTYADTINFLNSLVLIPTFSGSPDFTIESFLRTIENTAKLTNWSDLQKCAVARQRIVDTPAAVIEACDGFSDLAWPKLKETLISQFGVRLSRDQARAQLYQCQQGDDESVLQFAARIRGIGKALAAPIEGEDPATSDSRKKFVDEDLLSFFVKGLKPSLYRFVATKNAKSLKDAISFAETEEAIAQLAHRSRSRPAMMSTLSYSRPPTPRFPRRNRDATPNEYGMCEHCRHASPHDD